MEKTIHLINSAHDQFSKSILAIMLFYEQNNARFFKELFIDQFKFAVENYFLA